MHRKKLNIVPSLLFRTDHNEWFEPVLFRLLESIRESGKLTAAARTNNISYRHAWNLLNRGTDFFGVPLVEMRKGQGTQLSALGEKLLWADQRVKARLEPQIASMASEFNDEIQQILAGAHRVLRIHASHGYAVSLLPDISEQLEINLQFRNPDEALAALQRGDCDMASFHFPTCPALADKILEHYKHHLEGQDYQLIRLVTRQEGLMMRPELAGSVQSLPDLVATQARFIGRDRHSGSRILLNLLLEREGLGEGDINRMPQEELTHTAVAAFVASGMADVGFGVEAAARQFGLEFIALTSEHYLLLCKKNGLPDDDLADLIRVVQNRTFREQLEQVPGYAPDKPGEVTSFEQLITEDR